MKRLSALISILAVGLALMGADGCSSDPNVEGAKLDLRNKDYDRALENLETALQKNPQNAEALDLKGRVLFDKAFVTEDPAEHIRLIADMVAAFNAAEAVDPMLGPDIQRSLSMAYVNEFQRGIQAFNNGRTNTAEYGTAAEYFETASVIRPDSSGAYVNRAYALMNLGDNAAAVEPLEMGIEKGDEDVNSFRLLARLYQEAGRHDEAIALLRRASSIAPNDIDVQAELLNAFQLSGQIDDALMMYESAVERDPGNKLYRYNFGTLLVQMDRFDEAIEQLEAAIAIDSAYGSAHYNLGTAYINHAVIVHNRINELDDSLRANRNDWSDAQIAAAEAEIDRFAAERRSLFAEAIPPLETARRQLGAAGESITNICIALYQAYVQTNQIEQAQGVAECAGYSENGG